MSARWADDERIGVRVMDCRGVIVTEFNMAARESTTPTTRRHPRTMREAFREWPESCIGIAEPVVIPCSRIGRIVLALRRWLRGAR